jgi:phosphocarrier protein FPr
VWIDPSDEVRLGIAERRAGWLKTRHEEKRSSHRAARTRDGRLLQVEANIIGLTDARIALEYGADGIGVMRTEFLYLQRSSAPDEEEQVRVYAQIAAGMGQRPFTIRTLDIGGDKYLPYLPLQTGDNPFLGQRGVRVYRDYPDLLKTQLRSILRASPDHTLSIMIPMVSTCDEIRFVKAVLGEAREELRSERRQFAPTVPLGIMIELPSAVALADQLALESDFFSIGTNDLCQYTLAIDRNDPDVSGKHNAFHPALLRLVRDTVAAGHRAGIPVGLCGELAGMPEAAPLLVGLELDVLSMNPESIPAVKKRIVSLNYKNAKDTALGLLDLDSAQAVYDALTTGE